MHFSACVHWMFSCCRSSDSDNEGSGSIRWVFTLEELWSATNNFNYDNKIGEGPVGSVYWGQLSDGSQIVAKKLKESKRKAEMEFAAEVEILGRVRHKNLLSLRGYCVEGHERILIYDYMSNFSLFAHLHGMHAAECRLDWHRRMSIAIGAARGIAYLHHHANPQIIHTSIKATNILLDSDFQTRVGDFGIARLVQDDTNQDNIANESQLGYLAPEYVMFGKATMSTDIYSFGILLLELASGRRPVEKSGSTKNIAIRNWVLPLAKEDRFNEIADTKLNDKYVESEVKKVVLAGLLCTRREPDKRPSMLEVVAFLKGESKEILSNLDIQEVYMEDSMVSSHGTATPEEILDYVSEKDHGIVAGR